MEERGNCARWKCNTSIRILEMRVARAQATLQDV